MSRPLEAEQLRIPSNSFKYYTRKNMASGERPIAYDYFIVETPKCYYVINSGESEMSFRIKQGSQYSPVMSSHVSVGSNSALANHIHAVLNYLLGYASASIL